MPEASLIIDINAQKAIREMDKLQKEMTQTEKAGNRLSDQMKDAGEDAEQAAKGFSRFGGLLKGGLGITAALAAAKGYSDLTDRFKSFETQLRLVTNSQLELEAVQSRLDDLAEETAASYEGTVTLFARLSRATKDLGITQDELFATTEALNLALRISGATAEEANNALIQLSQGLASGTLRGDEFNSVAEQAPPILDAVAEYLGVARGELREMAADGEITADVIVNSMTAALEGLREQAEDITPTVGAAAQKLADDFGQLALEVDKATGISDAFISALEGIGDAFSGLGGFISEQSAIAEFELDVQNAQNRVVDLKKELANFEAGRGPELTNDQLVELQGNILDADKAYQQLQEDLQRTREGRPTRAAEEEAELAREKRLDEEFEAYDKAQLERQLEAARARQKEQDKAAKEEQKIRRDQQREAEKLFREQERLRAEEQRRDDEAIAAAEAEDQARMRRSEMLQAELDSYLAIANPLDEYIDKLTRISELQEMYPEHAEELSVAAVKVAEDMGQAAEKTKENLEETDTFFTHLAERTESLLSEGIFDVLQGNAQEGFMGIAEGWKRMLDRMVADALASQVMDFFRPGEEQGATGGKGAGGVFGSLMGFVQNLFRADGGPVAAGRPYVVGEQGPELFVPKTSGEIVAGAGGPGGSTIINMHISGVQDAGSFSRNENQIMNSLQNRLNTSRRNL